MFHPPRCPYRPCARHRHRRLQGVYIPGAEIVVLGGNLLLVQKAGFFSRVAEAVAVLEDHDAQPSPDGDVLAEDGLHLMQVKGRPLLRQGDSIK